MQKVPYDLRGMSGADFARMFRVSQATVSGWKKDGEMPYWASIVPIGDNPAIAERDAEIARLNTVIDELVKRLAR
jgi:transposase